MNSKEDNWIRIFYIPDTSLHAKGFTLYKVISMLYPKSCPDSVTKVTVWKRYNDFKKLHRDLKTLYRAIGAKEKYPNLASTSYFKRFDKEVIRQRKESILKFLEFVASHSHLFSSDVCVNFFKTSHTPSELMSSNIHSIRAELNLPLESDFSLIRSQSDDEHTLSDTDSVSTLSSINEHLPDLLIQGARLSKVSKKSFETLLPISLMPSLDSSSVSTGNFSSEGSTILDGQICTGLSNIQEDMSSYLAEASHYINRALEFEDSKKFQEAFEAYKSGIDILLRNVKDDGDLDRRDMVRFKIEKYLLRAEKIYNIHLSTESKIIQNYVCEINDKIDEVVQESESDLYKYKVIKIISSGMLTLHLDFQQLFYVKVINKTVKFSNDKIILPGNVPYMVKLHNYYNCEHALILVLQYCSGYNLNEYIKQRSSNCDVIFDKEFFGDATNNSLDSLKDEEESDDDSDHSYSDLILNYTSSRYDSIHTEKNKIMDDENEKVEEYKSSDSDKLTSFEQNEITYDKAVLKNMPVKSNDKVDLKRTLSRKSSEISEWSVFDDVNFTENFLLPIKDVIKWTSQLLLALERLHLLGVICCDLQTKNLLIDESGNIRLTYVCNVLEKYDLAFSKKYDLVLAPEMYSFQPITEAVDWWSFGAILYELLVGMSLNYVHPEGLSAYSILRIPKYVSVEGRSLLKQLLAFEPNERLGNGINGAEDIKLHPFFNSVIWDDLAAKWKIC